MSPWAKLVLGPARSVPCRACGLAVGVAVGPALAAFIPCAAVVVAVPLHWLRGTETMIASGIAAIAATCVLYWRWVPLVRRELTSAAAVKAAHERHRSA